MKYKTLDGCNQKQWNMSFNWIILQKPYHNLNILMNTGVTSLSSVHAVRFCIQLPNERNPFYFPFNFNGEAFKLWKIKCVSSLVHGKYRFKTNHDDPYIMGDRRITIFITIIFKFT